MASRQRTNKAGLKYGALGGAILAAATIAAAPAATAARTTIYDNIPSPLPGNVVSLGFEATSTSEFGGQVGFDGTGAKPKMTILLSSFGCENGFYYSGDCGTTKGLKFSTPITVNVYAVNEDNTPGTKIGSVTHTFKIPYRPSANNRKCTGADAGKWYSKQDDACYNGFATTQTVSLGDLDLPDAAIISVAYNTTHHGYDPIGEGAACFTADGGCGYDALNVGFGDSPATVGSQPAPADAYLNSTFNGNYCDSGASGTGTFRLDAGCYEGYQPGFRVSATGSA